MLYKLTCFRDTLYPRGLRPYKFYFKMDCKAVSNAVVISWYQRQRKVFISFYFWLFWQSVNVAFFTWHNISNNTITIATIIHVLWDAVRCSNKKNIYLWQQQNNSLINLFDPLSSLKKKLWHRCFSVNFAKFLRTAFFTENLWCLLLIVTMHYVPVFHAAIQKAFRKKDQVPWEMMKEIFLVRNRKIS